MRRRPRSENLDLYDSPALRTIRKAQKASDEKQKKLAEEEFTPRRQKPQHPTSAEFEEQGRVEPKDA